MEVLQLRTGSDRSAEMSLQFRLVLHKQPSLDLAVLAQECCLDERQSLALAILQAALENLAGGLLEGGMVQEGRIRIKNATAYFPSLLKRSLICWRELESDEEDDERLELDGEDDGRLDCIR